ncbi:MAG TPA: ADP-ribosylglycohydrolase family protein [Ktedonobacteraceae bacterium]|nr:ADP-ribosylglycohydrolase family protein [Ktedonobacteraceae bacterium]
MTMVDDQKRRFMRALLSLEGLSVGDALGERFFFRGSRAPIMIARRELPPPRWDYTDDTRMALSIVAILHEYGEIDQDALAAHFAKLYVEEPRRGYGPAMHDLLPALHFGHSWREQASALFGGMGSFGNGAAMRIAPLGAYFADDLDRVASEAERAAVITHAHPEAVVGAIAVAIATAHAVRSRESSPVPDWRTFFDVVLLHVPASEVHHNLQKARDLSDDLTLEEVCGRIGNGSQISAQDTVPFVLWCAAHHLHNFEEAIWTTLGGFGDIDTNAAMVGGIVAPVVGLEHIPTVWRKAREPLPDWLPILQ